MPSRFPRACGDRPYAIPLNNHGVLVPPHSRGNASLVTDDRRWSRGQPISTSLSTLPTGSVGLVNEPNLKERRSGAGLSLLDLDNEFSGDEFIDQQDALVAQWIERPVPDREAEGSNPSWRISPLCCRNADSRHRMVRLSSGMQIWCDLLRHRRGCASPLCHTCRWQGSEIHEDGSSSPLAACRDLPRPVICTETGMRDQEAAPFRKTRPRRQGVGRYRDGRAGRATASGLRYGSEPGHR